MPTPGLSGGRTGALARAYLSDGAGTRRGPAEDQMGVAELRTPDVRATIEIAGGSGYGPPATRPLNLVQADLEEGHVTPGGAASYGVTLGPDGRARRGGSGGGLEPRVSDRRSYSAPASRRRAGTGRFGGSAARSPGRRGSGPGNG